MRRFIHFILLVICQSTWAQLGVESLDFWPRAHVLPVGQSVVNFEGQYAQAGQQLNSDGQLVRLGQDRSQRVSWKDVMGSVQQQSEKAKIQSELSSRGVSENETAAHFDFEVDKQQFTQQLGWLYGLTPSWMIGVQVPIVHTSIKVKTFSSYSSNVEAMSPETQSQVKAYMKNELHSQGYTDFEERPEQTTVGDIQLMSQHRVYVKGASAVAVRGRWTFPSGFGPRTSDFFDLGSSDGQNDLGADILFDYILGKRWTFNTIAGYTAQLPDTVNVRKPVQDGQTVTSTVVRDVKRDLGDVMKLMVTSEFRVVQNWRAVGAWVLQQKSEDKFSKDFKSQPGSQIQLAKVGVQYVTGANSLRRDVRNQWVMGLNHWRVLSGRNVLDTATTTLDVMFFY